MTSHTMSCKDKDIENVSYSLTLNPILKHNKNMATSKPGSGRTKGSFSFVTVTLAELKAKFNDEQMPIVISRKWAEQVGFKGLVANAANKTMDTIQGKTPETVVDAKVTLLEDE